MALIRNLSYLRNVPVFGKRIAEAFDDVQRMISNIGQQTNSNLQGQQNSAPSPPDSISVTAGGGVAHVQLTDGGSFYRGKTYHVQYAADAAFSAPITAYMGPSRDIRIPVGSQPLYYRAFSDQPTSGASDPIYHGGANPVSVAATGTQQPAIPAGQGSGTGTPSEISGFGPIPYRGSAPPRRS
jgi:hypothetical protein